MQSWTGQSNLGDPPHFGLKTKFLPTEQPRPLENKKKILKIVLIKLQAFNIQNLQ